MPRSRSMSMESSTCSTISRSASPPVDWMSRSASVDLPWSICAMIAKLRMLGMALRADRLGRGGARARGGAEGISAAAGPEDGKKDRFRMGRADARAVELVGNERFDPAPQARPVADDPVMHEQPAAAGEGMAVRPRDRRAGRRAHMREIEVRLNVAAEIA